MPAPLARKSQNAPAASASAEIPQGSQRAFGRHHRWMTLPPRLKKAPSEGAADMSVDERLSNSSTSIAKKLSLTKYWRLSQLRGVWEQDPLAKGPPREEKIPAV